MSPSPAWFPVLAVLPGRGGWTLDGWTLALVGGQRPGVRVEHGRHGEDRRCSRGAGRGSGTGRRVGQGGRGHHEQHRGGHGGTRPQVPAPGGLGAPDPVGGGPVGGAGMTGGPWAIYHVAYRIEQPEDVVDHSDWSVPRRSARSVTVYGEPRSPREPRWLDAEELLGRLPGATMDADEAMSAMNRRSLYQAFRVVETVDADQVFRAGL